MANHVTGVSLLGSTGSVGTQTLDVIRNFPDKFDVVGLAAHNNYTSLKKQVLEFHPTLVSCNPTNMPINFLGESEAVITDMESVAATNEADIVVVATTGYVALKPILKCMSLKKNIAIANKESIIIAGDILKEKASKNNVELMPLDSEPSAIWQCLKGEDSPISKLIITASGGALRNVPTESIPKSKIDQVLKHPTWNMGVKITVDSATMMNKAFEVIEAKWLFDVGWENIEVIIHPESIIHSMVEFEDGSTKAQLSRPNMRLPIQYALFHPHRQKNDHIDKLDLETINKLTFEPVNQDRYPCFDLAIKYAKKGHTWPSVLTGADEGAVRQFVEGKISFGEIPTLIESTLSAHKEIAMPDVAQRIAAATWAYEKALELSR